MQTPWARVKKKWDFLPLEIKIYRGTYTQTFCTLGAEKRMIVTDLCSQKWPFYKVNRGTLEGSYAQIYYQGRSKRFYSSLQLKRLQICHPLQFNVQEKNVAWPKITQKDVAYQKILVVFLDLHIFKAH